MKRNIVLALIAALILAMAGVGCAQTEGSGAIGEAKAEVEPGPEAYTVTKHGQILGPDGNCLWQLPKWEYSDYLYCEAQIVERAGHVYAVYHSGGATMGSDHQVRLTPSEAVDLDSNKNIFEYDGVSFGTTTWVPPGPDNLYMKKDGKDWVKIGDPKLIYGWNYHVKEDGSEGGSSVAQMEYDGSRYLYVIGFEGISMEHSEAVKQHPGVYRVDIKTNETVRVSPEDKDVIEFEIKDGEVVY